MKTRYNHVWIAALAALMAAALACGGSPATPTAPPTVPPTPEATPTLMPTNTPKPTPTETPPAGASIQITNESDADIWEIHISTSDATSWGEDWLSGDVIKVGESHLLTGIPEGRYDVQAVDENGEIIEQWWDVELSGQMNWNITGLGSLEITNSSDWRIGAVYISSTDSDSWGKNWLGSDVIDAGSTYVVNEVPRGYYDVKVEDPDGNYIEAIYNARLLGLTEWEIVGKSYLPDNVALQFEDEFDDNRNNWGGVMNESIEFLKPEDGKYCILIKTDHQPGIEWYEPFVTDEFAVETICTVEGAGDATCGLGYGPDLQNVYWFEVSPSEQLYALHLMEGGEWQADEIEWTYSWHVDPARTNFLRMERVGDTLSVFVNSILLGTVEDVHFAKGRVGVGGSTYKEANAKICIDRLRVWRLE